MNIDLMRRVDYWVGIPLCFIFSLFFSIHQRLLKKKKQSPIKNILFIELSEMGSTVLAYPSIKRAQELYQNSTIFFLIFENNKESVEILNCFMPNHIFTIRSNRLFSLIMDTIIFFFLCRKYRIDTVVDMELFSRFSSVLTFLSGAERRVGFYNYHGEGLYRGSYLTHRVTYNAQMHMSQNFMALIESLNEDTTNEPLVKKELPPSSLNSLCFSPDESLKSKIQQRLKKEYPLWDPLINKLFILNPNPGDLLPIRGWPLEYFAQLARALLDAGPNYLVVLIGLSEAKSDGDFIQNEVKSKRCINFIGYTEDLKEMITLFSFGETLITSDSGPAHFAPMTNIRVVVLFGPETPRLYAPLGPRIHVLYKAFSCSPCVNVFNHRKTPCSDNRCLQSISTEKVLSAVLNNELLQDNRMNKI